MASVSYLFRRARSLHHLVTSLAWVIAAFSWNESLYAQTDDFDSGTDAGWSKITNPQYPAIYSFPADSFGGKAYRLQAGAPSGTIGGTNTARAVAYRADRVYTNFYVAADIVAWDPGYTNGLVFGLIARASNLQSGLIDAVTFTVRINHVRDAAGSRGRAQIYGFAAGGVGSLVAQDFCTLIPGRKYRFVMSGTNNILSGQVYDLEDLTHPLTSMSGDDAVANSGFFGAPLPDPAVGGYSGIYNVSLDGSDPTTDTTFDNFIAAELPPTSVAFPATPHGQPGIAQVVNRSPASFRNFYPASSGITFNATTLTTTNTVKTNAIRLYLNNVDVSSSLNITGPATNATVTYNGLVSNVVYEARIELEDALGRKTTNAWTFDTFSDAYLAGPGTRNIECEDFDFLGGQFIDDPPPSGYATNDINNSNPINSGTGYVDLDGTAGVDFFDYDGGPRTDERDFRFFDPVGTQRGLVAGYYSDASYPTLTPYRRVYDTQRQKYFNVDPMLHEYVIERTEGGEWLNYTRIFTNTAYYNVYLRYNSGLAQPLTLDVLPGPTILGTFDVKASCTLGENYRYAPLLDGGGRLAVVNLSGTNTVRLTMASPQVNSTKHTSAFNYLAFVPALLVESAAAVGGPYAIEPNAAVELGARRITIPVGSARFYRLRWDRATTIASVQVGGGNVQLTYQ